MTSEASSEAVFFMPTQLYQVHTQFKTLCCIFDRKPGEVLRIFKEDYSPKRILVVVETGEYPGSIHKVKRSTFHRCTQPLEVLNNRNQQPDS